MDELDFSQSVARTTIDDIRKPIAVEIAKLAARVRLIAEKEPGRKISQELPARSFAWLIATRKMYRE